MNSLNALGLVTADSDVLNWLKTGTLGNVQTAFACLGEHPIYPVFSLAADPPWAYPNGKGAGKADLEANLAGISFWDVLDAAGVSFQFNICDYVTDKWNEQKTPTLMCRNNHRDEDRRRFSVSAVGLILATLLFVSCTSVDRTVSGPRLLSLHEVQRLALGTDIDTIIKLCGPPGLTFLPIYPYPAKEGGRYIFYFIPTNEAGIPAAASQDKLVLVAVTKVGEGNSGPDFPGGYYVLPTNLFGKAYTGLKAFEPPAP